MSKDLIEKYGRTEKGMRSYREAVVRKALRIRFWTIVGSSVVVLGLLGGLYLIAPYIALGLVIGVGAIAGLVGAFFGLKWVIQSNAASHKVISHVKRVGVIPDE